MAYRTSTLSSRDLLHKYIPKSWVTAQMHSPTVIYFNYAFPNQHSHHKYIFKPYRPHTNAFLWNILSNHDLSYSSTHKCNWLHKHILKPLFSPQMHPKSYFTAQLQSAFIIYCTNTFSKHDSPHKCTTEPWFSRTRNSMSWLKRTLGRDLSHKYTTSAKI